MLLGVKGTFDRTGFVERMVPAARLKPESKSQMKILSEKKEKN